MIREFPALEQDVSNPVSLDCLHKTLFTLISSTKKTHCWNSSQVAKYKEKGLLTYSKRTRPFILNYFLIFTLPNLNLRSIKSNYCPKKLTSLVLYFPPYPSTLYTRIRNVALYSFRPLTDPVPQSFYLWKETLKCYDGAVDTKRNTEISRKDDPDTPQSKTTNTVEYGLWRSLD